ncbi:MAG: TonB family protein [Alphaproteobacteria bacterium]|nr:TonB family protein [Alphaproteobacteria bacterium]
MTKQVPPQQRLPFQEDEGDRRRKVLGFVVAVLVHALLGWLIYTIKPIEVVRKIVVEVTMADTPEELPPEPEPEPEPEKPPEVKKEIPKEVDFDQTTETPDTDAPQDTVEADKPIRRIQGLDANSFAEGSGSGFSVRAGTTLRTRASDETMDLEEAANSVAFTAVTSQPKVRSKPPLRVPDSVQALRLEGVVEVLVDIDENGDVTDVTVAKGLHPDADEACRKAWLGARFAPAVQEQTPVAVRNAPYRCRIEIIE